MFGQSSWGWWGTSQFFFSGTEGASQTAFFIYHLECDRFPSLIQDAIAAENLDHFAPALN